MVVAADLTALIGSLMPVVLVAFFVFVSVLRRRDRRRSAADDEP